MNHLVFPRLSCPHIWYPSRVGFGLKVGASSPRTTGNLTVGNLTPVEHNCVTRHDTGGAKYDISPRRILLGSGRRRFR